MEFKSEYHIRALAVKAEGKFTVYISNHLTYDTAEEDKIWDFVCEQVKAKYQDAKVQDDVMFGIITDGLFLFATEQEAREFYSIFTQKTVYASGLYAELISPVDGIVEENT